MEATKTKLFGPARIVALALIALAVLGLAYLRFAPDAGSVSVPSGARADQVTLEPCTYATEQGNQAADCGTLVVRENRHDPHSRLIALPVKRIRAHAAHPGNPIFRLQGGPGITNMTFPDASRFTDKHDVVLVGYRGVDGSSRLDCPEVASARKHSRDFLSEKSFRADAAAFKACADGLTRDGVDLAGYSLPQRVDDLEAARRALGYKRIDLISESAGTRTALIYAWRYPKSIHRSVMVGVNPPGHFLWDARTTGEQIRRYAALCGRDASCRARAPDLAASMRSAFDHVPDHWWFLPIKKGNVKAGAFMGLVNSTREAAGPLAGPATIDMLLSANNGDASGAWLLSVAAQLVFPDGQVWGELAATSRADAAYARRFFASGADRGSIIGSPAVDFLWAGGRLVDAWPANPDENEYTRVRDTKVETLLIGGNLDFATPPQNAARDLLPHLENGRQVVITDLGHSDDFWPYQPAASTRLINTYLATGKVDTSLYRHHKIDFTPTTTQTKLAKIVLAVIIGFAALAALMLVWMALRSRRRGGFGGKASPALRVLSPFVLGFGGWFAGVLIVLTTLPGVPLDDELLAGLSVGVPVGLGIYWAWVRRDRPSQVNATGFAAALAGALVGTWLGFNTVTGLFGLVPAIVGAAAGANLVVLFLDVARDRSAREAEVRHKTALTPAEA